MKLCMFDKRIEHKSPLNLFNRYVRRFRGRLTCQDFKVAEKPIFSKGVIKTDLVNNEASAKYNYWLHLQQ